MFGVDLLRMRLLVWALEAKVSNQMFLYKGHIIKEASQENRKLYTKP